MTPLNDPQRQEIENQIFAGRKLEAIKLYRDFTGAELVDAKNAVEDLEVDLRRRAPDRFIGTAQKSGCLGVVLATVAAAAGVVWLLGKGQ